MYEIIKTKEKMSSAERVIRSFYYEPTDRVPIDYMANPGIQQRLCQALSIPGSQEETLLQALGVDYREISIPYCGKLYFPLKDADEEVIRNYPLPHPDEFDYTVVQQKCLSKKGYARYIGNPGFADIINSTGRVMGMEDTLVNLLLEDEATLSYIQRKTDLEFGIMERALHHAKGEIEFMWLGEDLGTQIAPMISLELYRKVIKPVQKKFVELANQYKIPVLVHTCGCSSWAYEDFIEIGIKGVDTLQPEATNMNPNYLKEKFHGRLSFHGCVSTAGVLAYGTTKEVEEECINILRIMSKGGGYQFAPTHMIQDNTPVENVIAMYQSAHLAGTLLDT